MRIASFGDLLQRVHNLKVVNCELWTPVKPWVKEIVGWSSQFTQFTPSQKNITFLFQIENCKFWCSLTKSSQFASCELWTVNSSQTWVQEIKIWSSQFAQFTPFSEKHNVVISNWELQVLVISYKEFTIWKLRTVNCELQTNLSLRN